MIKTVADLINELQKHPPETLVVGIAPYTNYGDLCDTTVPILDVRLERINCSYRSKDKTKHLVIELNRDGLKLDTHCNSLFLLGINIS